jgi:ribosomal-protein-alanine N-acetyltransferase
MQDFVIKKLTRSELSQVEEIEKSSFSLPWSRSLFEAEFTQDYSLSFGAFVKNQLLGYIFLRLLDTEAHIIKLATHFCFRQQGIATRLLQFSLKYIKKRGIKRVTIEVRERNSPARKLYQKCGFLEIARRQGYYHDTGEDAIIMWIYDLNLFKNYSEKEGK